MIETKWSFDEFLAFLLIYASHADINFTADEKEFIINKVTKSVFENMYSQFEQMTDYKALEMILSYKSVYYSTAEEKAIIFQEMHKLFGADGEYSILEKELYQFLDKMM